MELSIQSKDENWLLRMCHYIVVVIYSVTLPLEATQGRFTSVSFLRNKKVSDIFNVLLLLFIAFVNMLVEIQEIWREEFQMWVICLVYGE
jgi:hypothetical protein